MAIENHESLAEALRFEASTLRAAHRSCVERYVHSPTIAALERAADIIEGKARANWPEDVETLRSEADFSRRISRISQEKRIRLLVACLLEQAADVIEALC